MQESAGMVNRRKKEESEARETGKEKGEKEKERKQKGTAEKQWRREGGRKEERKGGFCERRER